MGNVPSLTAKQLLRILRRHGFVEVGQRGSHVKLRHADGRYTTVPVHPGRTIPTGLLRAILKQTGLTVTDLTP